MIGSQEVMALWSNEGIEELSFFSAESNKPSFLAMKSTGGKLLVFQSVFLQKATNITHADASLGNEICSVNTSVEASLSIQQQPHVAVPWEHRLKLSLSTTKQLLLGINSAIPWEGKAKGKMNLGIPSRT